MAMTASRCLSPRAEPEPAVVLFAVSHFCRQSNGEFSLQGHRWAKRWDFKVLSSFLACVRSPKEARDLPGL